MKRNPRNEISEDTKANFLKIQRILNEKAIVKEMDEKLNFNLLEVKSDLIVGINECNKRGLVHSGKSCEVKFCLQISIKTIF